jgi:hypothetical protein
MTSSSFEALELHDAILRALQLDFAAGTVTVTLARVQSAFEFTLVFSGVAGVNAPRNQPWGPSASVNALRQPSTFQYEIEMQSGDVLVIEAKAFSAGVEPLARSALTAPSRGRPHAGFAHLRPPLTSNVRAP